MQTTRFLITGVGEPLVGRVLFYDARTARTRAHIGRHANQRHRTKTSHTTSVANESSLASGT